MRYGHALLCRVLHRPHTGLPPLPTKGVWWSLCKFRATLTTFFFISRRREWKKEGWRHRERKDEMRGRASRQMEGGCWEEKGGGGGGKKRKKFQILAKPKLPYWVSQDTLSLSKRKRLHCFVGGTVVAQLQRRNDRISRSWESKRKASSTRSQKLRRNVLMEWPLW